MRPIKTFGVVIRAAAAAATLVLLIVGPPLLLTRYIGWPLPTRLDLADIRRSLGGATISDDFLLKALAVACWIAWALVVASAITEIAAWMRRESARQLPLATFVQPAVRHLVVAALMLFGTVRPTDGDAGRSEHADRCGRASDDDAPGRHIGACGIG